MGKEDRVTEVNLPALSWRESSESKPKLLTPNLSLLSKFLNVFFIFSAEENALYTGCFRNINLENKYISLKDDK